MRLVRPVWTLVISTSSLLLVVVKALLVGVAAGAETVELEEPKNLSINRNGTCVVEDSQAFTP